MSLADIATIASVVSSAAVVVSLIYLSLQIRQTQRNQQALMQQTRTAGITDMNIALADPAIAAAYNKGLAGDPDMTSTEVRQFLSLARCGFINMENNFIQHHDGLMSDEAFHSALEGARFQATFPGLRAAWRQSRGAYGKSFAAYFDPIVESGAQELTPDASRDWRAALTAETKKLR
jgi:hypothetical protein